MQNIKNKLFILSIICLSTFGKGTSQTVSDTFDTADIPTNLGSYSSSCNGPSKKLSIQLPAGESWNVTGIDISYNMTAQAGGFKSHQRSYIRCQNTATSEDSIYIGSGNTGGVQTYNRTGVSIANNPYPANTVLNFEMRAWRTNLGSGCNTTYNRVDNFSWIITVHYSEIPDEGSVSIGTATPAASAILDLSSTSQAFLPPRMTSYQRDAIVSPVAGMMIFNTTTQKLEIYTNGWGTITFSSPGVNELYGGIHNESATSIQQTSDGGFIVAGYSSSSNTGNLTGLINNGPHDYWIVRLDNFGNILWQKLLGGSNFDQANSIQQTSDGGFILAGASGSSDSGTLTGLIGNGNFDYWILKLDNIGNIVWQKLLGGSHYDEAHSIKQSTDGGFIVAGSSNSSNTGTLTGLSSNGGGDCWILKLDNAGNIVWQKLLGGSDSDGAYFIQQTTDGGFIVAGYAASSNTGTLTGLINNGSTDYWIIKLDESGNIIWQKLYGGDALDIARSIQQTSDGGFIVAGYAASSNTGTLTDIINNGSNDYWLIKLDDSGNIIWQILYGGIANDYNRSIEQTSDGGFITAGYSSSSNTGTLTGLTNNGADDYWILKLNRSGNIVWQKLLGGSAGDFAESIQQTSDGGFVVAGYSSSTNTGTLTGQVPWGLNDYWILKLDANGNPY